MIATYLLRRLAVAALAGALAGAAAAVGPNNALNDTGITTYGDSSRKDLASEPADYPGQDARYGRDAAAAAGQLPKAGGGSGGFDFTKIANSGAVLPAGAPLGSGAGEWACTYDNVTGLMWEVKVDDPGHLRYMGWTYTWYDSNYSTNGGFAGYEDLGYCGSAGRCDTEKFVTDVNAAGLCGHGDWRMPTIKELQSIVDYARAWPGPVIDPGWFPNTYGSYFWSASAFAYFSYLAWYVSFDNGYVYVADENGGSHVRLVRAGQ